MRNTLSAYLSVKYIQRFIGQPYRWGGDDPMAGFDCSGLALEMLKSAGLVANHTDMTAQNLANHFSDVPIRKDKLKRGCLVFYGSDGRITHVAIAINKKRMIEAGGGGSRTRTESDAIQQNAYIRERQIDNRSDFVIAVDPFQN